MPKFIPFDVIIDIFSLLPVETLLRFRCLSTTFCRSIDSTEFVKLHINQSLKTRTNWCLLVCDYTKPGCSIYSIDLHSSDMCPVELDHPYVPCSDPEDDILYKHKPVNPRGEVFGSCNGLLAMFSGRRISLWNPSTKKQYVLPKFCSCPIFCREIRGFGYDAISDDYKVIEIIQLFKENYCRVFVYSLKSNSWRRIDDLRNYYIKLNHPVDSSGVFVGGFLHWTFFAGPPLNLVNRTILAFDVGKERFKEVAEPDRKGIESSCLSELGGYLSMGVTCPYRRRRSHHSLIEIWIMKEYGGKESWTKLVSLPDNQYPGYKVIKPLCYSRSGDKVLVMSQAGDFFWCDIEEERLEKAEIFKSFVDPVLLSANISIRSIVPLIDNVEIENKRRKGAIPTHTVQRLQENSAHRRNK